jgi:imidazole glycerol-phosphate synthase subunit HisF
MLRTRVIPCLLLFRDGLVKTRNFADPLYVGDPLNAVRIFNEKEVDELVFLDIAATQERREPNFSLVAEIAAEAFMPFAYGGGVRDTASARSLVRHGAEKIIINSAAIAKPGFIRELADVLGSSSTVVAIDARRTVSGRFEVVTERGRRFCGFTPETWAVECQKNGAGELLLTDVDREGSRSGYDLELIRRVTAAVDIPVVAHGGAGSLSDMRDVVVAAGASAAAAGSQFVLYGKYRAVLITYPSDDELRSLFASA